MKKIILYILSTVIILTLIFIVFQFYNYNNYNINSKKINNLDTNDSINITTPIPCQKYATYNRLKIRDDFADFQISTEENTIKYVNKNNRSITLVIGMDSINLEKYKKYIIDEGKIDNKYLENFLVSNNLSNDIDFYKYISLNNNLNITPFSKIDDMKKYYLINSYIDNFYPFKNNPTINFISGSYNGYMIKTDTSVSVNIEVEKTNYYLNFDNRTYFTNNYILELLNTIVIE